jgi:hypothetical protein
MKKCCYLVPFQIQGTDKRLVLAWWWVIFLVDNGRVIDQSERPCGGANRCPQSPPGVI